MPRANGWSSLHALVLCEATQLEIGPQSAAQKPDTTEFDNIVVKKGDAGASTGAAELGTGLLPGLAIELMIACQVQNRHRPVGEGCNRLGAVVNVTREHQQVSARRRFDDACAREALLKKFKMKVRCQLDSHD